MRTTLALLLLLAPAFAGRKPLCDRFPGGAAAYVEVSGLAGTVRSLAASPLGEALGKDATIRALVDKGAFEKISVGLRFAKNAWGLAPFDLLDAFGGKDTALALYPGKTGTPPRALLVADVDAGAANRLLGLVDLSHKNARRTVLPAEEGLPPVWKLGSAYVVLDGDRAALSNDRDLADVFRRGAETPLSSDPRLKQARSLFPAGGLCFGYADRALFASRLHSGKAGDLGQALLQGELPAALANAPYSAFQLRMVRTKKGWSLQLEARAPLAKGGLSAPVASAFGGTLEDFPFALPGDTLAVLRLRRDLSALWSNRDSLLSERGIPGLANFETNFGNISAGMSFSDEFLPNMRGEIALLAVRPEPAKGAAAPRVRYPQLALVIPLKNSEALADRLKLAFQTAVSLISATQTQKGGSGLLQGQEPYKGVDIQTARYLKPTESEMRAAGGLPVRYNFTPSFAIVNGCFVLGSTREIVCRLVDGAQAKTPAPAGVNAGLWIRGPEVRKILEEDKEALIANKMISKGESREAAEGEIEGLLGLLRYADTLRLFSEQDESGIGLRLSVGLSAGEK